MLDERAGPPRDVDEIETTVGAVFERCGSGETQENETHESEAQSATSKKLCRLMALVVRAPEPRESCDKYRTQKCPSALRCDTQYMSIPVCPLEAQLP